MSTLLRESTVHHRSFKREDDLPPPCWLAEEPTLDELGFGLVRPPKPWSPAVKPKTIITDEVCDLVVNLVLGGCTWRVNDDFGWWWIDTETGRWWRVMSPEMAAAWHAEHEAGALEQT